MRISKKDFSTIVARITGMAGNGKIRNKLSLKEGVRGIDAGYGRNAMNALELKNRIPTNCFLNKIL